MPRKFRVLTADDSLSLIALWRETWTAVYGPSLGQAVLAHMLEELERNGTKSMLPGSGERGYCIASGQDIQASAIVAERGNVAYLWGMYVRPSCQRRGLGSILLKGVASQIVTSTDVEVRVLPTSPWAVSFYQKLGLVETGTEDFEVLGGTLKSLIMSAKVEALKELSDGK